MTNINIDRRKLLQSLSCLPALRLLDIPYTHADEKPKRQVAVTIDDGPAVGVGNSLERFVDVSSQIRNAFVAEQVPAIMFVNEQQLNVNGQRDARANVLDAWLRSNLDLGNHTYSHKNLNDVELWQYFDEIVKGEVITRAVLKSHNQELKWFRYPFLASSSGEKAKAVEDFLTQRNYRIAPVTVDYADYSFASTYSRAVRAGDKDQSELIVRSVLTAIDTAFERAEGQSKKLLGYEIPLILLIHCNELNAHHLAPSLSRIRDRGYEFVSLDQAMEHPIYKSSNLPAGAMGGSFFSGLARTLERSSTPNS